MGDSLVDAERGVGLLVVVLRGAAGASGRDARNIGRGSGRAAGGAAAPGERLGVVLLHDRDARSVVGERVRAGLVGVDVGVDFNLRLAGSERPGQHGVDLSGRGGVIARPGGLLGEERGAAGAPVAGGPKKLARRVGDRHLVGVQAGHAGGNELRDSLDRRRIERRRARQQDGTSRGLRIVGKQLVLWVREHQLHLRGAHPLDALNRLGELAFEGTLVSDLLLEVARAELLLVEQREPRLLAAEQAGRGQRHAGLRGLVRLHGQGRPAVLQLVRDALGVERARDLAGLRRIQTGQQRRVAGLGGHLEDEVEEQHRGRRAGGDHGPAAGRELGRHLSNGHGGLHLGLEDLGRGFVELCAHLAGELHGE